MAYAAPSSRRSTISCRDGTFSKSTGHTTGQTEYRRMHAEGLAGRRVLVVEDESMVTMLLLDLLNEIGCEVAGTASRLGEAMNKALTLAFDVAILDVNLNGEMSFPLANALLARGRPLVF